MDFIDLFNRVSTDQKEKFLFNLLENHEEFRKKFTGYFEQDQNPENIQSSLSEYLQATEALAETYREDLEAIDLIEPDWENWVPPHSGYIERWEAEQMMIEQSVKDEFSYYGKRVNDLLIAQNIAGLFQVFFALYKACITAKVNDENENLGDPEEFFIDQLKEIIDNLKEKVEIALLNDNKVNSGLEMIVHYLEKHEKDDMKLFAMTDELLQQFIKSENTAQYFSSLMAKTGPAPLHLPKTRLKSCEFGDTSTWVQTAENLFRQDNQIARQLMEHYLKEKKTNDFYRVAREVYYPGKQNFYRFLLDKINDRFDVEFSKDLLSYACKNLNDISVYKRLMAITNKEERNQWRDGKHFPVEFYVKILEAEGDFDELLQYAKGYELKAWHLKTLLAPILHKYPEDCFRILKETAAGELQTGKRGRHLYSKIADWLKFAYQIPGKQAEALDLARQFFNHVPRLPALKDEINKTGLLTQPNSWTNTSNS